MPAEDLPHPAPFTDSNTDLVLDPEVLAADLAQELLGKSCDHRPAQRRRTIIPQQHAHAHQLHPMDLRRKNSFAPFLHPQPFPAT